MRSLIFVSTVIAVCLAQSTTVNRRRFPADFKFGVANAATQIEGGWLSDGKSFSIWDYMAVKHPEKFSDHSTPAIACDSYHKYKEDVAMVKAMGLDFYRLSIAWPRIFPSGYPDKLNEAGVQYYRNLLKELRDNDIEPMVTLYHWDLPQILQDDIGGWLNQTTADLFGEYARACFKLFGDDVKWWITINEPKQVCQAGYGYGGFAPGVVSNGIGEYICSKNVILAHAKAYHIYNDEFKSKQGGKVSMVIDSLWFEPSSDAEADKDAAERFLQFGFGLYGNAIFRGDWPKLVKDRIAMRSKLEGFAESRLPSFTKEEIDYVNGTYDYLALNHYATHMASGAKEAPIGSPSFGADISASEWSRPEWPKGNGDWFSGPSTLTNFGPNDENCKISSEKCAEEGASTSTNQVQISGVNNTATEQKYISEAAASDSSDCSSASESPKSKRKKSREVHKKLRWHYRFSSTWLKIPEWKEWLTQGSNTSNGNEFAYCNLCYCNILAHKSVIKNMTNRPNTFNLKQVKKTIKINYIYRPTELETNVKIVWVICHE